MVVAFVSVAGAGVAAALVSAAGVALVSPAGAAVVFVSVVVVVVLLSVDVPPPQAATDATNARLASDKAIVLIVISLIRLLLRLLVCLFYRFFPFVRMQLAISPTHMKRPQLYKHFEWAQTSWHDICSLVSGITS